MGNSTSGPSATDIGNALSACMAVYQPSSDRARGMLETIRQREILQHNITEYIQSQGQTVTWSISHVASEDLVVIAFRGTFSFNDLVLDNHNTKATARGFEGVVHSGFLESADTIPTELFLEFLTGYEDSQGRPPKRIILCGHSMGGAIAAVALALLLINPTFQKMQTEVRNVWCITFGSPDVGDIDFLKFMREKHQIQKHLYQYRTEFDCIPGLMNALHDHRQRLDRDFADEGDAVVTKLSAFLKQIEDVPAEQMGSLVDGVSGIVNRLRPIAGERFLPNESHLGAFQMILERSGQITLVDGAESEEGFAARPFPVTPQSFQSGIVAHSLIFYVRQFSQLYQIDRREHIPFDEVDMTPPPSPAVSHYELFSQEKFSLCTEVSRTRPSIKAAEAGFGSKISVQVEHPFACLVTHANIETWGLVDIEMTCLHVIGRRAQGSKILSEEEEKRTENVHVTIQLQTVFDQKVVKDKFPRLYTCRREETFTNVSPVQLLVCVLPIACGDGGACQEIRNVVLTIAPGLEKDIQDIKEILRKQSERVTSDSVGMHNEATKAVIFRVDENLRETQEQRQTQESTVLSREHAGMVGVRGSKLANKAAKLTTIGGVTGGGVATVVLGATGTVVAGAAVLGVGAIAGVAYGLYHVFGNSVSNEEKQKRDDVEERVRWTSILKERYPAVREQAMRHQCLSWLEIQRICDADATLCGQVEANDEDVKEADGTQNISALDVFRARWADQSWFKKLLDQKGESKDVIAAAEQELRKNLEVLKLSYHMYDLLARQKIVGVIGTKSAGKTTLCNQLFRHPAIGGKANDSVYPYAHSIPGDIIVIDFPHSHISDWSEGYRKLYETLLDVVIIVLDANKRGCEGEEKIYQNLATSVTKDNVIVLFNKCDEVIKEVQVDRAAKRARRRGFQKRGAPKADAGRAKPGGGGGKDYKYKIMSDEDFGLWKETCRRNVVKRQDLFGNVLFTSINVAAYREYDQLFDEYDQTQAEEWKSDGQEGDYVAIERDVETLSDVLSECREIQTCGHILELVSNRLELDDERHNQLGEFCFADDVA